MCKAIELKATQDLTLGFAMLAISRVLEQALLHATKVGPHRCLVIMATHNEETICHSVSRLLELGLDPTAGHVVFAQIYGMAEQISVPLGEIRYYKNYVLNKSM